MDDEARLARAFKAYEAASRNRDADPEEFEAARTRYMFLKNGDAWLAQEKRRIESEKLDPIINQFRDMYKALTDEEGIQKAYTDSVETIKDKQENITSGAKKQSAYFKKLIDDQKSKKSAYDRYVELTSSAPVSAPSTQRVPALIAYFATYPSTFTILLDIALAGLVIFLLFAILRRSTKLVSGITSLASAVAPSPEVFSTPLLSPDLGPSRSVAINPR
jgi:hypothetical protein